MSKEKIINEVTVVNLADEKKYIEEVSTWVWEEWSKAKGVNLEEVIYRTNHSICKDRVPQVLIAKLNDDLVGTVSIWYNDLTTRQDLTPWLAALYVNREYRGRGIGALLQEKCIELAKKHGYKKLYLITDHENYYEKTGWTFLTLAPDGGHQTRIYEYDIK